MSEKKPLDKGLIRTIKIVGGLLLGSVIVVGGLMWLNSSKEGSAPPPSTLGRVIPPGEGAVTDISPAAKERLARVQESEAEAARRAGRSYVPDAVLGQPSPVAQPADNIPPPSAPTQGSYAQYQQNQQRVTRQGSELGELEKGLLTQLTAMVNGMAPATVQTVKLMDPAKEDAGTGKAPGASSSSSGRATAAERAVDQDELVGADEILPATLRTPIDTYKSQLVLVRIEGGALEGAELRGQVVPMKASGDVEDVGMRFTSMRFKGQYYEIDAIALNEQTATDAMNGDVDRRIFDRFVMPVLMAGLSGASTYFTAVGTPSTSVATGVGDAAVIVDQERASREDAKNQGIGGAIDKGVQIGERAIDRAAAKPNRVTLERDLALGIMFNAPVYVK